MAQIGKSLEVIKSGVADFCDPRLSNQERLTGIVRIATICPVTDELGSSLEEANDLVELVAAQPRTNFDQTGMTIGATAVLGIALENCSPEPVTVYIDSFRGRFGWSPRRIAENVLDSVVFSPGLPLRFRKKMFDLGKDADIAIISTKVLFAVFRPYDVAHELAIRRHWQGLLE